MASKSRALNILCWALQLAAAAIFVMAGAAKLMGEPRMVTVFDIVGMGQWFRYLTGGLEVTGALALLWPRTVAPAAAMLAVVMLGAVGAHLTKLGGSPAFAMALLLACLAILWLRRDQLPFFRA